MKKSNNTKTLEEILNLSAELGLQISAAKDCLRNVERFGDRFTYKMLVLETLHSLSAIAAQINEITYEYIYNK